MTEAVKDTNGSVIFNNHNDKALLNCVERLDELLQKEEILINTGWPFDLDAINGVKAHLIHEFAQLSRTTSIAPSAELEVRLKEIMRKATRNSFILEQYFLAIQEISRLMIEHAKKEESDGTYSRRRTSWRYDIED
jgi:hypothetical protein